MDKLDVIILLILALSFYICCFNGSYHSSTNGSNEHMASIDCGSYKNPYPRGKCNKGLLKRSACSVGNCPLESTISDDEFAYIQCAQDPDPVTRKECYVHALKMMKSCK